MLQVHLADGRPLLDDFQTGGEVHLPFSIRCYQFRQRCLVADSKKSFLRSMLIGRAKKAVLFLIDLTLQVPAPTKKKGFFSLLIGWRSFLDF